MINEFKMAHFFRSLPRIIGAFKLEGKIWEIRLKGKEGIARALYIALSGQRLSVLHVFIKITQKTPRGSLEIARPRIQR
jgi:phage-related protein